MSVTSIRGGTPYIYRGAVTTTVVRVSFSVGNSNFLKVRTDNAVRMYFTQAHATALDTQYVLVPAAVGAVAPYGEWSGPADVSDVWLVTASGTANVELVAFTRFS